MPIPAQVDEKFGRGGNGDQLDEGLNTLNDSELDSEPLLRPPPDSVWRWCLIDLMGWEDVSSWTFPPGPSQNVRSIYH